MSEERIPDSSDEMIRSFLKTSSMEDFLGGIKESLDNKDSHVMITITLTAANSKDGFASGPPHLDVRMWHQREPSTPLIALYTAQNLIEDAQGILNDIRSETFSYSGQDDEEEEEED